MTSSVKSGCLDKVYLCFLCLNSKFSDTWQCRDEAKTYRRRCELMKDISCLHISTSFQGICKHTQGNHKHELMFNKNGRVVLNYGECFVEISEYLDHQAWHHSSNLYYAKHPFTRSAPHDGITPLLVAPSTVVGFATPLSRDRTNLFIPSTVWTTSTTTTAANTTTTTAPQFFCDIMETKVEKSWPPQRSWDAVPYLTGSMKGRFWKRLYYIYSYNEATRIYDLQEKAEAEARKRQLPPPPTVQEIVMTKFGGDWELWSDHITWKEECDDYETHASKKAKNCDHKL